MEAGYRPCKRCRPDLIDYRPVSELADKVKHAIDNLFADKTALLEKLDKLGVSRRHMTEIFVNQYGYTPSEYANKRRIEEAKAKLLDENDSILEIVLSLGFESLSSFYTFFKKYTKMSPGNYRQLYKKDTTSYLGGYFVYDLAMGKIAIASDGINITAIQFADCLEGYGEIRRNIITDLAARQLDEYFCGKRKTFELPLNPIGTPFQKSVWSALKDIPYGSIKSYKQVAKMIGNPNASRAVGMANNKNPLLIVVPCHRVVGADGSLVGYAASLKIKKQLLNLEQENIK